MKEDENKNINVEDEKLKKVDGGGFFSSYSEEEYNAAGVEVVGWGYFYNDGYRFQGKDISTEDANTLAFFTYYKGYPASSIEEANEFRINMGFTNYLKKNKRSLLCIE